MEQDQFTRFLASEGFQEITTVAREAGAAPEHEHPFEAKALILQGEIRINTSGAERLYQTGQVFHILPNVLHSEVYGPSGVTYLVGRKT